MEARSFEVALRAAAKVTLGTALFGCGAVVEIAGDDASGGEGGADETSYGGGGATVASDGGGGATGGATGLGGAAPLAICSEPEAGWVVYDAQTFGCCVATIEATAPADPTSDPAWGFANPDDPTISGCCAQILSENYQAIWDQSPLPHPTSDHVISACCMHSNGTASCTPWGPPCPPAMEDFEPVPWVSARGLEEVLA